MPWGAVDPMGLATPDFLDYLFGALDIVDEVFEAVLSPFKGGGAPGLAADMERSIREKEEIARDLADSPYGEAAEYYVGGLRRYQKAMGQAAEMAETAVLFTIAPGVNIESGSLSAANMRSGAGLKRFKQGADVVGNGELPTSVCFVAGTQVQACEGQLAIETIQVGDRVAPGNQFDTGAVDPDTSGLQTLTLLIPDPDSTRDSVEVELLRPVEWAQAIGANFGSHIDFELPELGISGPAVVLDIDKCPTINQGPGRLVIATIVSNSSEVI